MTGTQNFTIERVVTASERCQELQGTRCSGGGGEAGGGWPGKDSRSWDVRTEPWWVGWTHSQGVRPGKEQGGRSRQRSSKILKGRIREIR